VDKKKKNKKKGKTPPKKGRTTLTQKAPPFRRDWTWRKPKKVAPDMGCEESSAESAEAAEQRRQTVIDEALGGMGADVSADERKKEYYAKLEAKDVWEVSLHRKYPFGAEGETELTAAIAHCRSQGKTPLLLDRTAKKSVDAYFRDQGAVVLETKQMLHDEKQEIRGHDQIMKEARQQLTQAMRSGKIFYVLLEEKVPEFASGKFSGSDTLPMQIFEQEVVDELEPFYPGGTASLDRAMGGLWESSHPFAKCLRVNEPALLSEVATCCLCGRFGMFIRDSAGAIVTRAVLG